MKILISAVYVSGKSREGGVGRYYKCLSDALRRMGHQVYTSTQHDEYEGEAFDLVICSHFIPKVQGKKIFVSHGMIKDESMMYGADEYVSVSHEVRNKNLQYSGLDSRIIPQPIDIPEYTAPNETLQNILIIRREDVIFDPFYFLNDKYNISYSNLDEPIEDQIQRADLVISLGRGALEAMAAGRPVFVADNRKYIGPFGDGYLTSEILMGSANNNFSGRFYKFALTQDYIEKEISKYDISDGIMLREYVNNNHASDIVANEFLLPHYKFVFGAMVNDHLRLKQILKNSALPENIKCNTIEDPDYATKGLNILLDRAENDGADVCVLTHQDMHYPVNWIQQAQNQIRKLPDDWVLAGIMGKALDGAFCGHLHDARIPYKFQTDDRHTFPCEAACFDELCILVNMKSGFRFDEWLEGFDLYGTLGPLQVRSDGKKVWIIDAFATHYCMRSFDWHPDKMFADNFKKIYNKYSDLIVDSTVFGVEMDEEGNVIKTVSFRREPDDETGKKANRKLT